jgi:hypothetical protein
MAAMLVGLVAGRILKQSCRQAGEEASPEDGDPRADDRWTTGIR